MHQIKQFIPEVYLTSENGKRYVYKNLRELVKQLGRDFVQDYVGTHFKGRQWEWDWQIEKYVPVKWPEHYEFIVRNGAGDIITRSDLLNALALYEREKQKRKQQKSLPNKGSKRYRIWWNDGGWRNPQTMNARKGYQLMEEGEPSGRNKAIMNLPVYYRYDDWWHRKEWQRNWKKYRKTQWKA